MARNFNGSTQRLERASVPAVGAGPWTMACWARPTVNFGSTQTAFSIGTTSTAGMYAALGLLTTAKAFLETKGTTQGAVDATGATVSATLNNWIHLAATCSGSGGTSHIFANGTDDGSASVGTVTAGTMNRATIGGGYLQSATFGSNFKGDVCECAIWNVVLAQIDITMLALGVSPLMVQPSHLVFYSPVLGMSTEPDLLNATGLTLTAATIAAHVKMLNGRAAFNNPKSAAGTTTPVSFSDSGSGTDAATLAAALSAVESGAGLDSTALSALMSLADSAVGSDTAAVSVPISATDAGSGSDAASLSAAIPASETGAGTDAVASIIVALSAADSAAGVDTPSLAASLPAQADSATGADTSSLQANPTAADNGTGTEGSSLVVSASGQDSGAGIDTSALAAALSAADNALGNDSFSVLIPGVPTFNDAGVGTDSFTVVAKVSSSDTGAGTDAATIVFVTSVADVGAGADTISAHASVTGIESGSGTDTATVPKALIGTTEVGTGTDTTGTSGISYVLPDSGIAVDTFVQSSGQFLGTSTSGKIGYSPPGFLGFNSGTGEIEEPASGRIERRLI